MKNIKLRYKVVAVAALILIFVVMALLLYRFLGTRITVTNLSGLKVRNVLVETRNNSVFVGEIAGGKEKTFKLPNSFGESDITLTFESDSKIKKWTGGYIEGGKGYNVKLTIKPDGSIE
ncbi:MAG: hypothetical protein ACM3IL_04540 [Deltaproteobacteria bacterium]